jgi:transposase
MIGNEVALRPDGSVVAVQADGIALSSDARWLYFRPLIPNLSNCDSLTIPKSVSLRFTGGERWRFVMSIPVSLRGDFKASQLRALARKTKDGPQARRLLALAAIYDGATRTEAARIGGVTLQIIRDWVMRFNARGAAGLLDGKSPGQPSRLNDVQRQAIVRMIEIGPIPAIHGVVRWRLIDLSQWIYEEFRITVAKQTLSRELRAMGYRKLSARPRHHAQAEGAIEDFKKSSQRAWMKSRAKRQSMLGK